MGVRPHSHRHKSKRQRRYNVEEITWLDHVGPISEPDVTPKAFKLVYRVSVGYVVYEDEDRLVFAGTVDENGCHDMTALGVSLITDRRILEWGGNDDGRARKAS
jgi:hypothetical protein